MGNQCCQSTSTTQEDKLQINSQPGQDINGKQRKRSSKDKGHQQIDQKIDDLRHMSSSHTKENEYMNGEAKQEDATTDHNNNNQIQEKQKSIQGKQQSLQSVKQQQQQQENGLQQGLDKKHSKQNSQRSQQNGRQNGEDNQDKEVEENEEDQDEEDEEEQQENGGGQKKEEQKTTQDSQQQKTEMGSQKNQKNETQNLKDQQQKAQEKSDKIEKQHQQSQLDKDKKNSQKISTPKSQVNNMRNAKHKQSIKDFHVSADLFIHLKQGNISEEYKIGETLGEGAFGHVSKVTHKSTLMVRAMKCIKKTSLIKEEEQKLFSEMNILKNLDHPNIVRLYELYQDQKCYYLITEYCSGGELFDKIKSLTHFTEKMAADYMKQLLSAIFYCHQNKIVHRDLKPENLILESDKKGAMLKVIDFGTSRKFDSNKKMTKRLGTPYYIAPEVLNQKYDEKCDVWSCGVILYILLCGYPPFGGRSEEEILKKVKQGKVRFDQEDWDKMSNESKTLIKKMLTLDPKKRISAEQALNDPWVQKNAPQYPLNSKALNSLSQFYTKSKLKQTIMTFIVSQIVSRDEKEELQKTFRQLDKNGDGKLSKQELIEGYVKVYGDKEQAILHVERIVKLVDTNNSGEVDFTEFLMAAMQREQMLSKQKIETAFKMFDQDGNGQITREELQSIIGEIDDQFWKQILLECDSNKDGKISQNEFIDLLIKKKI